MNGKPDGPFSTLTVARLAGAAARTLAAILLAAALPVAVRAQEVDDSAGIETLLNDLVALSHTSQKYKKNFKS